MRGVMQKISIKVDNHLVIKMQDGVELSARLWLPQIPQKIPAIFEFIPYRKQGGMEHRDELAYPYFAQNHYAGVRVDLRGTGESLGDMVDEYTDQEWQDACEIIAWIAKQDWCDGNVIMMGNSWGGFNCLQLAALRPKNLRAVIASCATDDRYNLDIHYRGGCLLSENLLWSAQMNAYQSRCPDPRLIGEEWLKIWLARLENMDMLAKTWHEKQLFDDYWRHGSINQDFHAIQVPVLMVGGWNDLYASWMMRTMQNLTVPAYGVMGPWEHAYPNLVRVRPNFDFLGEVVKFADFHVKKIANNYDSTPKLRVFIQKPSQNTAEIARRSGFWHEVADYKSYRPITKRLFCHANGRLELKRDKISEQKIVPFDLKHGHKAGRYLSGLAVDGDFAPNQHADDARALCFETAPLKNSLRILGYPKISIKFATNQALAQIIVRLNMVAPDGYSTRLSYACVNLSLNTAQTKVKKLKIGKFTKLSFDLDALGFEVPAGYKLRLAFGCSYFSQIIPCEKPFEITLNTKDCQINLPILPKKNVIKMGDSPKMAGVAWQWQRNATAHYESDELTMHGFDDLGRKTHPISKLFQDQTNEIKFSHDGVNPLSCKVSSRWVMGFGRESGEDAFDTQTIIDQELSLQPNYFVLKGSLQAFCDATKVIHKKYKYKIKRKL